MNRLEELMAKDESLVVLTGDLGFSVLDAVRDRFPDRFYNVGISEQAMMGIAAGLAKEGKKIIVYSIIPFLIYRPYEQIMIDICYHNLPVVLIGSAEGFSYGNDAVSHYALNDLSLTLQLRNMRVYAPAEPAEAAGFLEEAVSSGAPAYLRLSKGKGESFKSKKSTGDGFAVLRENGTLLVSTGSIGLQAESAIERLEKEGMRFAHVHVGRIKPLAPALVELLKNEKSVISLEEHEASEGFGKFLSEYCRVSVIGVKKPFARNFGERSYMLKNENLDSEGLYARLKELARP